MSCFSDCDCTCLDWSADALFDDTVAVETTMDVTVRGVIQNHRGWYFDGPEERSIRDVRGLELRNVSGIYSFPGNGNEMRGTQPLCHHIGPAAWN